MKIYTLLNVCHSVMILKVVVFPIIIVLLIETQMLHVATSSAHQKRTKKKTLTHTEHRTINVCLNWH